MIARVKENLELSPLTARKNKERTTKKRSNEIKLKMKQIRLRVILQEEIEKSTMMKKLTILRAPILFSPSAQNTL